MPANKTYECWIKPPNGEWFNISATEGGRRNRFFTIGSIDIEEANKSIHYVPIFYCAENGFYRQDFFTLGYKMQWRPKRDKEWRQREEKRLSRTDRKDMYDLLPKEWSKLVPITDHYTHISVDRDEKQADLLSYTSSPEKGEEDVQTKIKAGRYLKKFYPQLSGDEIRYYSEAVQSSLASISMTDDPEEAAEVYQNGPNSCMKRDMDYFGYPKELNKLGIYHPVAAYFAGDLMLAYLGSKENPVARCLVWPAKKLYGRVYGAIDRMKLVLEGMGYTDDYNDDYVFVGARMKLIRFGNDKIVWPYTDGMASLYVKREDKDCAYIGPKKALPKGVEWYSSGIGYGENGYSSYQDPFIIRCAISRKIIKDEQPKDPKIVGRISDSRYAFVDVLVQNGYELLEGEEFWLPKISIIHFRDDKGIRKISAYKVPSNSVELQDRHENRRCFCHRKDAHKLCNGLYVYKDDIKDCITYKGYTYLNLEDLFKLYPQLNPGRTMFNKSLDAKQNRAVRDVLYRYDTETIARALLPQYSTENYP